MPAKRYLWTPQIDDAIREGYAKARTSRATSAAIDIVVRMCGYPRAVISQRAGTLGVSRDHRTPWTTREIAFLRENSGKVSLKEMAKALGRGRTSVAAQMTRSHIRRKVTEGYTRQEVARLLGISLLTVQMAASSRRLLNANRHDRFGDDAVANFLWRNLDHMDLRVVDQQWLKQQIQKLTQRNAAESERAA